MWRNGNPNITAWDDMAPAAREQWSSARRTVFPGSAWNQIKESTDDTNQTRA